MTYDLFGEASAPAPAPAIGTATIEGVGAMEILWESPELHSEAQTGKRKFWKAYAGRRDGQAYTFTEYWQDGSVRQYSEPKRIAGKNLGKANETTPDQQARSEAEALMKKQRDKGYCLPGEVKTTRVLAMLAKNYRDDSHRLVWTPTPADPDEGVDLQRKLDGIRLTTDGDQFWTREGRNPVDPRIVEHLRFDNPSGLLFDGEVMLPDFAPLEETVEAYKKYRPELSPLLNYHRFDLAVEGMRWTERWARLRDLPLPPQHFLVEVFERVAAPEAAMELHHRFVDEGWEGTMFRQRSGLYLSGKRPATLQKYKNFQEAEFLVVGYKEGEGKFVGTPVWRCVNEAGTEFDVTPRGSLGKRREIFPVADRYVGKLLTVRYEILTKYGVPRNPRGITFRDYEA